MASSPIGDLARRPAWRHLAAPRPLRPGADPRWSVASTHLGLGASDQKVRFTAMEKGEGKMIIGMQEGANRDRVRDQRIAKVVELSPPEKLLQELPLGPERARAVVRGRQEVVDVLAG